MTLVVC